MSTCALATSKRRESLTLSAKGALSSCQKEDFCPRNTLKTRKGKKGTLNFRLFRVFSGQSFFPDGVRAELLIDVQRHHRMNFPNCVCLCLGRRFELPGDVCWTSKKALPVTVITCGSRTSSFWESLKLKGKLCVVQPKTVCRSSHHVEPTGISAPTLPDFLTVGIFEHECNVTISFNFYAIEAASEVVPFLFSCDSCIRLGRQRLFRRWSFPLANLRWRN